MPAYERRMLVALWVSLVVPSLFVVQKYGGWAAVAAYLPLSAVAVGVVRWLPWPRSATRQRILALAMFVALVALFVVVYPIVNSHQPGVGSDDDDAYNVGARALLAWHSPYAETTYLGNVLHQFAGAFVLAAPFVVLLGTSAWQNLFWLAAFYVVLQRTAHDDRAALRVSALMLFACPVVVHQVLTGTGHLANALYVLLGLWYLARTRHVELGAAAWGVALASRANFIFLVPLAFGWLARQRGMRAAVRAMSITILVVTALIVPFYLHDPAHFGPLEAANRLQRVDVWVAYGGEAIAALMGVLAIALGCTRMDATRLFQYCAIVQAVPIVLVVGIELVATGELDLAYAAYGVFALPFVLAAEAIRPASPETRVVTNVPALSVSK